jgi:hypothetical protein
MLVALNPPDKSRDASVSPKHAGPFDSRVAKMISRENHTAEPIDYAFHLPDQLRLAIGNQERLANRVQLTTDGLRLYLEPIHQLMRGKVDYGMVVKMFSSPGLKDDTRYSPAKCIGAKRSKVMGDPDRDHISTSTPNDRIYKYQNAKPPIHTLN